MGHSIPLQIGEIIVTQEEVMITTVLGSCISVCLFTDQNDVGGMIHYTLPRPSTDMAQDHEEAMRYAIHAIPELIAQVSANTDGQLFAKLVGGACLQNNSKVGSSNVEAARAILNEHGIEIVAEDVGGSLGRKVRFHALSGRLQVQKLSKVKTLIVDDSRVIRKLLKRILENNPSIDVVGTAGGAAEAYELIKELKPDVVTLDINMPEIDGLEFLETQIPKKPIPVVLVSALNIADSEKVLKALELGAIDYVQKPSPQNMADIANTICEKVCQAKLAKVIAPKKKGLLSTKLNGSSFDTQRPIVIGASTGGTEAIKELLMQLPREIPPILIVQHIPALFSKAFADRLNKICPFHVAEARNYDRLEPGKVLIAPGGKHMGLKKIQDEIQVIIHSKPPVNRHRPSVDVLFNDAAELFKNEVTGVLLTGMGQDGARGLLKLKTVGAHTIAQSEKTCVVYGMPKAAVDMGAAKECLDLLDIPKALTQIFEKKLSAA